MSNAFAIAAVTAALKTVLRNTLAVPGLDAAVGGTPTVSALPPDRVNPAAGADPNQLNLFLYGVSPNPGWSNHALPVRDSAGDRLTNPPLALDLHYLLTAYAASDYGAEILLGHGMQVLHESPFFTREWLRTNIQPGPPPNDIPAALATSGLAEQIEQIRLTPRALSSDEMSKIWTAVQGRYRPTAAYTATVVLIEARRSQRTPLPVLARNLPVLPWADMRIDEAFNAAGNTLPITAGTTLRLRGVGLAQTGAQPRLMGVDLTANIAARTDTELDLALPAVLPAGVRAGFIPVQLVRPIVGNAVAASNSAGVLLRPGVSAVAMAGANVRVTFSPPVIARQQVVLALNQRQPAPGVRGTAFGFAAPTNNGIVSPATETTTIDFPIPGVPAGTYVVRLQVDGAESLLVPDGSGMFDQPNVTVP